MARLRGWRTSAILWVGRGALWVGCCALLAAGCATSQSALQVPLPSDAQGIWSAYWTAVERGDAGEVRRLVHSSFTAEGVAQLARPDMAGEARTFLYLCSVQTADPVVAADRARYTTRCRKGAGAELTIARDTDQVWRIL